MKNINALSVIFNDESCAIISGKSFDDFCTLLKHSSLSLSLSLSYVSKWFTVNNLAMNIDKKHNNIYNKKFFGVQIGNNFNWENHIDQLVPRLSGACHAVRSLLHYNSFKLILFIPFG
jgi:hypothetical protein